MDDWQYQKGNVVIIAVAVIAIIGICYFLLSSILPKTNKNTQFSSVNNNTKSVANSSILKAACKNAIDDYPEWTKKETDIIIWENPDKSFNFRNSPEDASTKVDNPVPSTETLADMDFVGPNEISYVTTGNNKWKINTLKLNGLGYDKSLIYEKSEVFSFVNVSPLSKDEFIALVASGNKGALKQVNTTKPTETIISEISSLNTENLKLSVSPKGTFVYLLQDNTLTLFEIVSKRQIDKINSIKSAVWVGNSYLLYSGAEDTYIYNVSSNEKSKIENINSVLNLTFNPKDGGTVAYDEGGNTKIIDCQTLNIINSKEGAEFKTLTSNKTAITQKGDQYGYWRFKGNDWGVKILEPKSKYVTIWQKY